MQTERTVQLEYKSSSNFFTVLWKFLQTYLDIMVTYTYSRAYFIVSHWRHNENDSWDIGCLCFCLIFFTLSRMDIFSVVPNRHPEAHKRKTKRLKETKKILHLKTHNFLKHLLNVSQLIKRSQLWMKMLMSNLALAQHSQNSELFFKPVVHTWLIRTSHLCGVHFSSLL